MGQQILIYEDSSKQYKVVIRNMRKGFGPRTLNDFKIDRQSPVGNPFVMHSESERDTVCNNYEDYFDTNIRVKGSRFKAYVAEIYKALKKHNSVNLYCWCAPKRCHGETIAKFLIKCIEKELQK